MKLSREMSAFRTALRRMDVQVAVVLTVSAVLVLLQMHFGSRNLYRVEIAPLLSWSADEIHAWGWWFIVQGVLGFVIPVVLLRFVFHLTLKDMGLGLGDWKFAGTIAMIYIPVVLVGTWVLSDSSAFQASYPHLNAAARNWTTFLIYEGLFLFYWIGWEYMWRGFVLFGTRRALGLSAIFVQALPFAIMHYTKPLPEALLSVVGGLALGALVWRSKSFWIAVPIHWVQMISLDFFCTLRLRSGVSGWGPVDAMELIHRLFSP